MRSPRFSALALMVLFSGGAVAFAQTASRTPQPIEFGPAQIDCSSYLTPALPGASARVTSSAGPVQNLEIGSGDLIHLADVRGVQPGEELRILRINDDWGPFEQFDGQHEDLKKMGHRVQAVGRLRILNLRGTEAVARVESICNPIHIGDFGIPWKARSAPAAVTAPGFDFARILDPASLNGAATVVAARDSAYESGPNDEIYLNLGTGQGARAGQFWLIVRDPHSASQRWLKGAAMGMATPGYRPSGGMPEASSQALAHVIGQVVVLWAEPASSTAIVTDANTAIYPGDQVIPMP